MFIRYVYSIQNQETTTTSREQNQLQRRKFLTLHPNLAVNFSPYTPTSPSQDSSQGSTNQAV